MDAPEREIVETPKGRAFAWPRFGLIQAGVLAATLVAGVLIGRASPPERGPLVVQDGVLVAHGRLAQALTTRLADDPGVIKIGMSLRAADGRYCRSFQSEMDRIAGLACREDGRWAMVVVTVFGPARAPAYRTAGSDTPAAVLAAVDDLSAGDPLDAQAERAARAQNWTRPPER